MNIAEIAKRANVSTATVSRAINQSGPVKAATAVSAVHDQGRVPCGN